MPRTLDTSTMGEDALDMVAGVLWAEELLTDAEWRSLIPRLWELLLPVVAPDGRGRRRDLERLLIRRINIERSDGATLALVHGDPVAGEHLRRVKRRSRTDHQIRMWVPPEHRPPCRFGGPEELDRAADKVEAGQGDALRRMLAPGA